MVRTKDKWLTKGGTPLLMLQAQTLPWQSVERCCAHTQAKKHIVYSHTHKYRLASPASDNNIVRNLYVQLASASFVFVPNTTTTTTTTATTTAAPTACHWRERVPGHECLDARRLPDCLAVKLPLTWLPAQTLQELQVTRARFVRLAQSTSSGIT